MIVDRTRRIACPFCHAEPGKFCVTKKGRKTHYHHARIWYATGWQDAIARIS